MIALNTLDKLKQLENEIKRVGSLDPRLQLNYVKAFPQDQGILIEIQLAVTPFNNPQVLNVFFNNLTNKAVIQ